MTGEAMMPNDSQTLPAISQHRSSTLRGGYGAAFKRQGGTQIGAAVQIFSGANVSHSQSRLDSSGKSSSGSNSVVSDYSEHRSGQVSSQFYTNGGSGQLSGKSKARTSVGDAVGTTQTQMRSFLPRLIDDQSFLRASNLDKERTTFSSRSLDVLPSHGLISEELRMRTVSLPSLGGRRKHDGRLKPAVVGHGDEMTEGYASYTTDDSSDEESPIVEIDPFPNVGTDSYLSSRLLPDFLPAYLKPWTPRIRKTRPKRHYRNEEAEKKRKELEALAAKERKRKAQGKSRAPRRRSVRSDALARKMESEAAKRHPVRKQFVYSELMQVELQNLTPKRLPGGKLKPIYNRRTQEGDIDIPTEIHISLDNLSLKPGEERIDFSDSPAAINKRRKEELQALLERRKKIQRQMAHKKKRKVHFLLPDEHRKDEVNEPVNNIAGRMQNENGSTSSGHSSNSGIEDPAKEGETQDANEALASQLDSRNLDDVVKDDVYGEGREYRIDRTNSWVANQTAHDSINSPVDGTANDNDNHAISTYQNPSENLEKVTQTSQSDPSQIKNGSQTTPLSPDISKSSTPIYNTNSNIQLSGERHETQDSSWSKRKHLSVDDDSAQVAQLNPLPGIRPNSPLISADDAAFEGSPLTTYTGAVREIRFLSERLPSIIISDT